MAKWAIIGASSFSGAAFCRHLRTIGEQYSRYSRPQYDLNDCDQLLHDLAQQRPEYVVNFAALNVVADSWFHFQDYYRTNVIGVSKLYDGLLSLGSMKKAVQVSTPEVYGSTQIFLKEDAPFHPSTPYAVSRAAIDMHLTALHNVKGLPVCFTRSVNVYGASQQPYRIIPKTVLKILRGEKLHLDGGGYSKRSFIHIDDASNSIYRVATEGKAGDTYHTSTNRQTSIRALVEMICEMLGVRFSDHVDIGPDRPGKDMAYQLDSTKIRAELGWWDRVGLNEGLIKTVQWFADHADDYKDHSLEYQHKP